MVCVVNLFFFLFSSLSLRPKMALCKIDIMKNSDPKILHAHIASCTHVQHSTLKLVQLFFFFPVVLAQSAIVVCQGVWLFVATCCSYELVLCLMQLSDRIQLM